MYKNRNKLQSSGLELQHWMRYRLEAGALDEVGWNWSNGSGRLELKHWMRSIGIGALDEVDWNTGLGRLELEDWMR